MVTQFESQLRQWLRRQYLRVVREYPRAMRQKRSQEFEAAVKQRQQRSSSCYAKALAARLKAEKSQMHQERALIAEMMSEGTHAQGSSRN